MNESVVKIAQKPVRFCLVQYLFANCDVESIGLRGTSTDCQFCAQELGIGLYTTLTAFSSFMEHDRYQSCDSIHISVLHARNYS